MGYSSNEGALNNFRRSQLVNDVFPTLPHVGVEFIACELPQPESYPCEWIGMFTKPDLIYSTN